MPTQKQKKVAKLLIENLTIDKPLNGGQMLEKVGYSEHLVKQPNRVLESEGVQEALEDYGFNVEKAKQVVGQILLTGENDNVKLKAGEMIFKVHGTYAPEKSVNLNISHTNDSRLDALIKEIEDGLDAEGTT